MSILSKANFFAEKLMSLGSYAFLHESRPKGEVRYSQGFGVISNYVFLYKGIIFKKTISIDIKKFSLHYNLFTPKLRFIYSVKRLFAYCFDKAPTLYLIRLQWLIKITQALRKMILVLFCCVYKLEGGAAC